MVREAREEQAWSHDHDTLPRRLRPAGRAPDRRHRRPARQPRRDARPRPAAPQHHRQARRRRRRRPRPATSTSTRSSSGSAFVVLAFFGGAGLLLYGACWLLVPRRRGRTATARPRRPHPHRRPDRRRRAGRAADCRRRVRRQFWFPWPLAVSALIAWLLICSRDRVASPARRAARSRPPGSPPAPRPPGRVPAGPPMTGWAGRSRDAAPRRTPHRTGARRATAARYAGLAAAAPAGPAQARTAPVLVHPGAGRARRAAPSASSTWPASPIVDSAYPALALGITAADAAGRRVLRPGRRADPPRPARHRRHGRRHRGLQVDGGAGRAPDLGADGAGRLLRGHRRGDRRPVRRP